MKESLRNVFLNMSSKEIRMQNAYYEVKISVYEESCNYFHNLMKKFCFDTPSVQDFKIAKRMYDEKMEKKIKLKKELKILRSVSKGRRIEL